MKPRRETVRRSRRVRGERGSVDPVVLWIVLGLMTMGTVFVLSASSFVAMRKYSGIGFFWFKQVIWLGVGTTALYVFSRIDYRLWRRLAPYLLVAGLGLLAAVTWLGGGRADSSRWYWFGPVAFQPAEAFRLAFLVFAAYALVRAGDKIRSLKRWMALPVILLVASGLLLLQPDFSTVLTLWATLVLVLVAAGVRWRHLLAVGGPAVLGAFIVVFGFGYKASRLENYPASIEDPAAGSYQVRQAALAMGAGGFGGLGPGNGRAKLFYVPEAHTDFILAAVGEEYGFVGVTALLALFAILGLRALRIAGRTADRFGYFLAIGIGASLMVNCGLNAAVVMGLVPPTGLPLPFLSYGGSSLLFTAVGWGIVLNISRGPSPAGRR